ncbi:phosphoglycerate kinase [Clostridium sp. CAG:557]|jgi:phosphoglycerate kinase|nr:phosphoglycerate kinase [Clostridium sp. CAG:557]
MDYSKKKSVEDIDVSEKKVLLRCDFNVPFDKNGNISNTKRIDESLKTIRYLLQKNAKIIIVSHLGRPKGMKKSEYSLKPVVKYLSQVLNRKIIFVTDDIRENVPQILNNLRDGDIAVLENIRFYKEEELNDEIFSKKLASLADVYVNDAFGTVHRAHASTQGVTKYLPSVCGFLIKREIDVLGQLLSVPKHPFVAILGGAKVSDKIGVICNLLDKVDTLIIAGGMAYTFLNALGYSIGSSILEPDKVVLAKNIIAKAKDLGVRLVLPVDNVVGKEFKSDTEFMIVNSDSIPDGYVGLDIGAKTKEIFVEIIKNAKTIFWNGPVGVFEWANFRRGTLEITKAIANSDAVTVIGGGDSIAAVDLLGFTDKITHISTGGGASLEFLEGKDLPGILSLDEKI